MVASFGKSRHPVYNTDLDALEARLNVKLPGALRDFYLAHNHPEHRQRVHPPSGVVLHGVIPLFDTPIDAPVPSRPVRGVAWSYDVVVECLAEADSRRGIIPFGYDEGGNLICVEACEPGPCWWFSHDTGDIPELEVVSPSFAQFLAELVDR